MLEIHSVIVSGVDDLPPRRYEQFTRAQARRRDRGPRVTCCTVVGKTAKTARVHYPHCTAYWATVLGGGGGGKGGYTGMNSCLGFVN